MSILERVGGRAPELEAGLQIVAAGGVGQVSKVLPVGVHAAAGLATSIAQTTEPADGYLGKAPNQRIGAVDTDQADARRIK